jgi:predicted dehydrogenase
MADLGLQMLDVGWDLLGNPTPQSVFATAHNSLNPRAEGKFEVEEAATALIRFESDKSMELAASWAMNQPPQQNGAILRACGTEGALEVYTENGAVLYRDFDAAGSCRPIALKGPKMTHHGAMFRHLKDCMINKTPPQTGCERAAWILGMLHAIYKSAESGKSVNL